VSLRVEVRSLSATILAPWMRGALGLYLGGGVAAAFAARRSEQYLTVIVGLEQDSRGKGGWFAEAGIGGGVRLVAGYRILLRRRGA